MVRHGLTESHGATYTLEHGLSSRFGLLGALAPLGTRGGAYEKSPSAIAL